jgi:hypothetical protein
MSPKEIMYALLTSICTSKVKSVGHFTVVDNWISQLEHWFVGIVVQHTLEVTDEKLAFREDVGEVGKCLWNVINSKGSIFFTFKVMISFMHTPFTAFHAVVLLN